MAALTEDSGIGRISPAIVAPKNRVLASYTCIGGVIEKETLLTLGTFATGLTTPAVGNGITGGTCCPVDIVALRAGRTGG